VENSLASRDADDADAIPNVDESQETMRVRQVLADLEVQSPATTYRVFQLRCLEGRSVRQVAEELKLTKEQVRYRCCRMKRRFRVLYDMKKCEERLEDDSIK
jgi:DNA-directed RNA polymerase specialized sigma24 family protein